MIKIIELIENIPTGKKRSYLGKLFVGALEDYHEHYSKSEINLNELVVNEFNNLIRRDILIKDMKLFSDIRLAEIVGVSEKELHEISNGNIRDRLIKYYQIKFDIDFKQEENVAYRSDCQATLHDFQERIRRVVVKRLYENQKRFLIHMPTGSGKTRTAAEIIIDFIRFSSSKALLSENIKILWIAQSSELCFQAYETIKWLVEQKCTQDIHFGHFYGKNEISPEIINKPAIIFCSIQKLLLHYQDDIWQDIKSNNYLVVVDEAHRSIANRWVSALDYFVSDASVYLLGLTATPGIGTSEDERSYHLSTYYSNNKIQITNSNYLDIKKPIDYLVQRKFLAKIRSIEIGSNVELTDQSTLSEDGDFKFTKRTLKELAVSYSRNASIVNIIQENYESHKKILVFTCGLEHNKILQSILMYHGIHSATIDESTKNRHSIIDEFKNGNLMVLLNFGVLTTGFDAPLTDACIIARPISSVVMYSQMVGRILRGPRNNGNLENTLYTIKDNMIHGDYDDMFSTFNDLYR